MKNALAATAALLLYSGAAAAVSPEDFSKQYPPDGYIIGVGQIKSTGNAENDRRVTEILARNEIAKQIRVTIESEVVDATCEGKSAGCKNEVTMIIKQSVSEVLSGTRGVKSGVEKGMSYTVVVLPKKTTADNLIAQMEAAEARMAEFVERTKNGEAAAAEKARSEYLKGVSLEKESKFMGGAPSNNLKDLLKELDSVSPPK